MRTRFNWAQLCPKACASPAVLHDQSSAVLNQLRELRATLAGHTARLERVEEHVDQIDGQLRDIHLLIARALEQGAASRLRPLESGGESFVASATSQNGPGGPQDGRPEDRLEHRVLVIERRLAKVEDRLGG